MCFHLRALDSQHAFFVGSADGELVYADMVKPEGACWVAHLGPFVGFRVPDSVHMHMA